MVARAPLDPGASQLTFAKWSGTSFGDDGQAGLGVPILPEDETAFNACATASQERSQASISYVKTTQQYLLVFVCNSPGQPSGGVADNNNHGSAWFYATSDDLSDQAAWSTPQEIRGSWAPWTQNQPPYSGCPVFNGFYPTLMSQGQAPGQLTTHGFVFYVWGALGACDDPKLDTGRRYTSRRFTIITEKRP
jgi:hypothetical protein